MNLTAELTDNDYQMLKRSWITLELAKAARIARVTSPEGAIIVGRNGQGDYAGLIYPYIWPGETDPRDYRLRRDHPDLEYKSDGTTKEKAKYLSPPGRGNLLYFPPEVDPRHLDDASTPIILVEGEKKTLALWTLANWKVSDPRFLSIGLGGVWNWRGTIGKETGPDGERRAVKGAVPDLSRIAWKGRRVIIIFDSDLKNNPSIEQVRRGLASELKNRGADVFLVDLPDLPGLDKTGADDFLVHPDGGPERMLELIRNAKRAEPASVGEILNRTGIYVLTEQSPIEEIESALRKLRDELTGTDNLRQAAVRAELVKHLKNLRLQSPTQLVDAALSRPDHEKETDKIALSEPEPWPEAIDGADLLNEIASILCRYLVLPLVGVQAVALWILHTYTIEAASISPILVITSAEKRCGKTLLLELLQALVFRPLSASNITAAALFRVIESHKPTLLIDEADTFLHDNDELKGVINSGHRRSSAYVIRTIGDDHEPKTFNTFGPKAIAQIGAPQDTIIDRGIVIEMRRKKPDEKTDRFRSDRIFNELLPLRRKAIRFAKDNLESLQSTEPEIPSALNDRAQDSWRPLLAIAELAAKPWPELACQSALKLSGDRSEASNRTLLLSDIKSIFEETKTIRMASNEICTKLGEIEEHPWPEWRNGKPITGRQLAHLLEPLGIHPRQLRIGLSNFRGYELDDFSDTFSRYLPGISSATTLQPSNDEGLQQI